MADSGELASTADGFSIEEIKAAAAEVGLDPRLVERAANLVPRAAKPSMVERLLGGSVRHRREAHFTRRLDEEGTARLLSAIRAAAEQAGEGHSDSTGLTWHSTGEANPFQVSAHIDQDGTTVRLVADRRSALTGTALATSAATFSLAFALVLLFEAVELQSQVLGWSTLGGTMLGTLALGRAVWSSMSRRVQGRLDRLLEVVHRSVEAEDSGKDDLSGPEA